MYGINSALTPQEAAIVSLTLRRPVLWVGQRTCRDPQVPAALCLDRTELSTSVRRMAGLLPCIPIISRLVRSNGRSRFWFRPYPIMIPTPYGPPRWPMMAQSTVSARLRPSSAITVIQRRQGTAKLPCLGDPRGGDTLDAIAPIPGGFFWSSAGRSEWSTADPVAATVRWRNRPRDYQRAKRRSEAFWTEAVRAAPRQPSLRTYSDHIHRSIHAHCA